MQGKFVIEKSCRIGVKDVVFVSVTCNHCKSEMNIAAINPRKVTSCGVCGTPYIKEEYESIQALCEAISFFKESKVIGVSIVARGGDDERK